DHRHHRLLRARRERPHCRAAQKRYELAPVHSINSSARASSVGGISRFWQRSLITTQGLSFPPITAQPVLRNGTSAPTYRCPPPSYRCCHLNRPPQCSLDPHDRSARNSQSERRPVGVAAHAPPAAT